MIIVKIEFHNQTCHQIFVINSQYTFVNVNPLDSMVGIFNGLSRIDGFPIFNIISHNNPIQTYTYNGYTIKNAHLVQPMHHTNEPTPYDKNRDRLLKYIMTKFDITHEDLSDDGKFNQKLRETILKDILE